MSRPPNVTFAIALAQSINIRLVPIGFFQKRQLVSILFLKVVKGARTLACVRLNLDFGYLTSARRRMKAIVTFSRLVNVNHNLTKHLSIF